jgi:hypothetical protein
MPYYRCDLDIPLPPDEVCRRLQSMIGKRPAFLDQLWGAWKHTGPPFYGSLDGWNLKMSRNIHYRNSFLPQIKGTVAPTGGGTRLELVMHVHLAVAVFMLIWLFFVISFVAAALTSSAREPMMLYVPLGMMLSGIVLPIAGFYPEAFKARRLIASAMSVPGPVLGIG